MLTPVETFTVIDVNAKTLNVAHFKFFPNRKRFNKMLRSFSLRSEAISPLFIEQMYLATKNTKISTDVFKMIPFSNEELKSLKMPVMVLVGDHDVLRWRGNAGSFPEPKKQLSQKYSSKAKTSCLGLFVFLVSARIPARSGMPMAQVHLHKINDATW